MAHTIHSNYRTEWETPPEFFNKVNKLLGPFICDAAASDENHLCDHYYTKERSALDVMWPRGAGPVWCNPPYGKGIDHWCAKVSIEAKYECQAVALLPSNMDTAWFHEYVLPYAKIIFIKGRLQFLIGGKRYVNEKGEKPGNTGANFLALYNYPECRIASISRLGEVLSVDS